MFLDLAATAEKMNPTTPAAAILVRIDDAALRERITAIGRRFAVVAIENVEELSTVSAEAAVVVVDEAGLYRLAELAASGALPPAAAIVCVDDQRAAADEQSEQASAAGSTEGFGDELPIDLSLPCNASDGEWLRALRAAREIAGLRARLRQTHEVGGEWARLAATDPLTELPNRRGWNQWFTRLVERSALDGRPLCVAVVDLDAFKQANDQLGHSIGDDVLRAVAEALRSTIRAGDFCARLGGDEFGLLLSGLPEDRVEHVFERIRKAATSLLAARGLPPVTCSFGYSMANSATEIAVDLLFDAADSALRQAKRDGRDRVRRSDGG